MDDKQKNAQNRSGNCTNCGRYLAFFLLVSVAFSVVVPGISLGTSLLVFTDPADPQNHDDVNVTVVLVDDGDNHLAGANITWSSSVDNRTYASPINETINKTAWVYTIPGGFNRGGAVVNYNIEAWDKDRVRYTAEDRSYTVEMNGSWVYNDFSKNMDMVQNPKSPTSNDQVNIIIVSRNNVTISQAHLEYQVSADGEFFSEYYLPFTPLDKTSMEVSLPTIAPGLSIRYRVKAFDPYFQESVSVWNTIEIPSLDAPSQFITLTAVDDRTGEPVHGAEVVVTNASGFAWNGTTNSQGWVFVDMLVYPGSYNIRISHDGEVIERAVVVEEGEDNSVFNVVFNENIFGDFDTRDYPQWYVLVFTALALAGSIPLFLTMIRGQRRSGSATQKMFQDRIKETGSPLRSIISPKTRMPLAQFAAFFALGLFGAVWVPFYPWWMVALLGFMTAVISIRYPYLSVVILTIFIIASAAYQLPEFGWFFMLFSLLILVLGVFDWKFAYLTLMSIFLAKVGLFFAVPLVTALLYSLTLGLAVGVFGGMFITFFVSFGNAGMSGLIVAPSHQEVFMPVSKPVVSGFRPSDFTNALSTLQETDTASIGRIFGENLSSMVPFLELLAFLAAVSLAVLIAQRFMATRPKRALAFSIMPAAFLPAGALAGMHYLELDITKDMVLVSAFTVGGFLSCMMFAHLVKRSFPEYFQIEIVADSVGTRLKDRLSLRRTTFDSIGGLDDIKEDIKISVISPIIHPELTQKFGLAPPKGVLLFGPPGCGKTLLMRAVSTELNVEMISIKCSDVMSKWYGESEALAENMFRIAKERRPCILFLDEIDAIAKRRDFYSTDDVTPRILSIMLSELDGMDESMGIVVVGATNMPDLVDPALLRPGRFDKVIFIPPPDYRARVQVLRIHMANKPMASSIDLEMIARRTDGFSGADLENLINESAAVAMRRSMRGSKATEITMRDIEEVLSVIRPSITEKAKKEYDKMGRMYARKMPSAAARSHREEDSRLRGVKSHVDYYDSEVLEWE